MLETLLTVNTVFDKVFVINLPDYWERRVKTIHQLKGWGIDFEVVEAVYGYDHQYKKEFDEYNQINPGEIEDTDYREIELRRNGKMIESPGAWGYLLSCQKIIDKSIQNNYKRILILDDDVLLHCDFEVQFSNFMNVIKSDWKVVKLGASQYGWKEPRMTKIGDSFAPYYYPSKVGTCGSFAVGLDQSVFHEVLSELKTMRSSFDNLPLGNVYKKYKGDCFVSFPNIITPDVTQSIIRSGRDQFAQGELMKWQMEYFPVFDGLPSLSILIVINDQNIESVLSNIHNAFQQDYEQISWHIAYPENLKESIDPLFSYKTTKLFTYSVGQPDEYIIVNNLKELSGDYTIVFSASEFTLEKNQVRSLFEDYLIGRNITQQSRIFSKNSFQSYAQKHLSVVSIFKQQLQDFAANEAKIKQLEAELKLIKKL